MMKETRLSRLVVACSLLTLPPSHGLLLPQSRVRRASALGVAVNPEAFGFYDDDDDDDDDEPHPPVTPPPSHLLDDNDPSEDAAFYQGYEMEESTSSWFELKTLGRTPEETSTKQSTPSLYFLSEQQDDQPWWHHFPAPRQRVPLSTAATTAVITAAATTSYPLALLGVYAAATDTAVGHWIHTVASFTYDAAVQVVGPAVREWQAERHIGRKVGRLVLEQSQTAAQNAQALWNATQTLSVPSFHPQPTPLPHFLHVVDRTRGQTTDWMLQTPSELFNQFDDWAYWQIKRHRQWRIPSWARQAVRQVVDGTTTTPHVAPETVVAAGLVGAVVGHDHAVAAAAVTSYVATQSGIVGDVVRSMAQVATEGGALLAVVAKYAMERRTSTSGGKNTTEPLQIQDAVIEKDTSKEEKIRVVPSYTTTTVPPKVPRPKRRFPVFAVELVYPDTPTMIEVELDNEVPALAHVDSVTESLPKENVSGEEDPAPPSMDKEDATLSVVEDFVDTSDETTIFPDEESVEAEPILEMEDETPVSETLSAMDWEDDTPSPLENSVEFLDTPQETTIPQDDDDDEPVEAESILEEMMDEVPVSDTISAMEMLDMPEDIVPSPEESVEAEPADEVQKVMPPPLESVLEVPEQMTTPVESTETEPSDDEMEDEPLPPLEAVANAVDALEETTTTTAPLEPMETLPEVVETELPPSAVEPVPELLDEMLATPDPTDQPDIMENELTSPPLESVASNVEVLDTAAETFSPEEPLPPTPRFPPASVELPKQWAVMNAWVEGKPVEPSLSVVSPDSELPAQWAQTKEWAERIGTSFEELDQLSAPAPVMPPHQIVSEPKSGIDGDLDATQSSVVAEESFLTTASDEFSSGMLETVTLDQEDVILSLNEASASDLLVESAPGDMPLNEPSEEVVGEPAASMGVGEVVFTGDEQATSVEKESLPVQIPVKDASEPLHRSLLAYRLFLESLDAKKKIQEARLTREKSFEEAQRSLLSYRLVLNAQEAEARRTQLENDVQKAETQRIQLQKDALIKKEAAQRLLLSYQLELNAQEAMARMAQRQKEADIRQEASQRSLLSQHVALDAAKAQKKKSEAIVREKIKQELAQRSLLTQRIAFDELDAQKSKLEAVALQKRTTELSHAAFLEKTKAQERSQRSLLTYRLNLEKREAAQRPLPVAPAPQQIENVPVAAPPKQEVDSLPKQWAAVNAWVEGKPVEETFPVVSPSGDLPAQWAQTKEWAERIGTSFEELDRLSAPAPLMPPPHISSVTTSTDDDDNLPKQWAAVKDWVKGNPVETGLSVVSPRADLPAQWAQTKEWAEKIGTSFEELDQLSAPVPIAPPKQLTKDTVQAEDLVSQQTFTASPGNASLPFDGSVAEHVEKVDPMSTLATIPVIDNVNTNKTKSLDIQALLVATEEAIQELETLIHDVESLADTVRQMKGEKLASQAENVVEEAKLYIADRNETEVSNSL